ncbi:MAG: hypothetical protein V4515_14420 [Chloroflexota bacterium]
MRLFIGGYDVSGDINAFSGINGGPAALEATDITQFANAKMGGRRAGGAQFMAFFDDATDQSHARLSALPTAQVTAMGLVGTAIGSASFNLPARQINYDGNRDQDGNLIFTVDLQSDGSGLEWGENLTAGRRVESAATNGTALDGAASTAFGWQAYLQVFALASGTPTIKLMDSADNATFADLTGAGFGTIAARSTVRLQGGATATTRRYVRVSTTGTFTGLDFAVSFVRNLTATAF